MGLTSTVHRSGLVLVEETQDEAGLRRALKQIDSRLRLLPPYVVFPGTITGFWRVVCQWSNDHPASPILTWMDANRQPLPPTSRILDEVQRLRMDGRNYGKGEDELNADLKAAVAKERADARQAIDEEYAPYLERGRVGVSMGARNTIPYWLRRNRGGYKDDGA